MMTSPFAIVPLEVFADSRLTLWHIRVLGALFSFRGKNTDLVWPKRELIADRTGMHPSNISKATSELVDLGWLQKDGAGGRGKATRYRITVPEQPGVTVAESTTVVESNTVADSTTKTVADSATRIEHTKEQTNKSNPAQAKKRPAKKNGLDLSRLPEDLSPEVWNDFVKHRTAIKAPLATQTGVNRLAAELQRAIEAGIHPDDALGEAIEAGWRGVKVEWLRNRMGDHRENSNRAGADPTTFHIPQGDDMAARTELGRLCKEAGITKDEIAALRNSIPAVRELILDRHPRSPRPKLSAIRGGRAA